MDPQYTQLQNDPPAYGEPETAPDHASLSCATEQNDSELAPGELARHVDVVPEDPIVRVTPLSYGSSSSYIKLRKSVLPKIPLLLANISAFSWFITTIILAIFDFSAFRSDPGVWSFGLFFAQLFMINITNYMFLGKNMIPGLDTFILYIVQVLAESSLQLFVAMSVSEKYYSKCLVAFLITALLGLLTLCTNYWYFHCAGQAALAAVAASQDGASGEEESHALASLGPSTTVDLPSEHKA